MDELAILRDQVANERRHLAAVKKACRTALQAGGDTTRLVGTCRAAAGYLVYSTRRLLAQDQAHCLLLRPRVPRSDAASLRTLDEIEETLKRSRVALQALEAAQDPVAGTRDFIDFIDTVLAKRRHSIEHLFRAHYTIDDWRAASFVDADSILEERERFAALRGALPSGITLDGEVSAG